MWFPFSSLEVSVRMRFELEAYLTPNDYTFIIIESIFASIFSTQRLSARVVYQCCHRYTESEDQRIAGEAPTSMGVYTPPAPPSFGLFRKLQEMSNLEQVAMNICCYDHNLR